MSKINQILRKIFSTFNRTTKILIFGMSQSGKSYLGRLCMDNYPRILIIDIMGEYQGLPTVSTIPDLVRALKARRTAKRFQLVYKFDLGIKQKEKMAQFDQICRLVFFFGNLHLNIEECDNYCNPHFIPEWWEHLLKRGRHNNISLTMSTQSPSQLNKEVVKQTNHIFIGMLKEMNDLNYCTNLMMGDRAGLLSLRPRWFMHEYLREVTKFTTEAA